MLCDIHVHIVLTIICTSCFEIVPVGPLQTVKHFVLSVITFMILYSSLIPISLIVQLEVNVSTQTHVESLTNKELYTHDLLYKALSPY